VFTRYWLHGKGPAPAGNLPVAVHLSPGRVALAVPPGQPGSTAAPASATLRLTVACGPQPASGLVTLDAPAGLLVTLAGLDGAAAGPDSAATGPLRYDLPGGGYASWELAVRALPGTAPGRYYLAAQINDELGQTLEDAALVTVGEPPAPPLDLPLEQLLPLLEADQQATAAQLGLRLLPAALAIGPGQQGEFGAEVTNATAGPVRGECQLISPFGTWQAAGPWTQGFALAPGEQRMLCYPVRLPTTARPGAHWWAVAKVMYFGQVAYSEAARIDVTGR
jgi:hypothetical protein